MLLRKPIVFCVSILLGFAVCGEPLLAAAQQYNPPRRGLPGRREGAGTRGTCLSGQKPLMPLVPADVLSLTTAENAVLYWYVPPTIAQMAEFRLLDGEIQVHATQVPLSKVGGITSYRLPTQVVGAMTMGKTYNWQFSIICDPDQPSKNRFVEGQIERSEVSSTLAAQLKQATPLDRAALYAANGIWQEAIATLGQERCTYPQDSQVRTRWAQLLQSVQLSGYVDEPLTQSCSALGLKPVTTRSLPLPRLQPGRPLRISPTPAIR